MAAPDSPVAHLPDSVDLNHAVPVAEGIWWVGHHQQDDPFQCHVYLLVDGDQSVLFDPGSHATFPSTLRKIEEVASFCDIRWFVCHHQDPDITGAVPLIDRLVERKDAAVVTHSRAALLLRYLDSRLPIWNVDEHGMKLTLASRQVRFVFTPYLHFPGSFATLDEQTGTLFSSDLFGGFSKGERLYLRHDAEFKGIDDFHHHYMPHRDILSKTMIELAEEPIERIAPQHGLILEGPRVPQVIERLKRLDCGIYSLARDNADIHRLVLLNRLLDSTVRSIAEEHHFDSVVRRLQERVDELMPVERIEFLVQAPQDPDRVIWLAAHNRYRGEPLGDVPPFCRGLGQDLPVWEAEHGGHHHGYASLAEQLPGGHSGLLLVPVTRHGSQQIIGFALFHTAERTELPEDLDAVLGKLGELLAVAMEREALHRNLELERDRIYERSIRDPLTGLYTRRYCDDQIGRMAHAHDRDAAEAFALVAVDIDHFKAVNDTHGHATGDVVLASVARCLLDRSRKYDMPVRFGGEEFFTYLKLKRIDDAHAWAERIRVAVEEMVFECVDGPFGVTVSAGVAMRRSGEERKDLERRADAALYEAKETGRNRVVVAP